MRTLIILAKFEHSFQPLAGRDDWYGQSRIGDVPQAGVNLIQVQVPDDLADAIIADPAYVLVEEVLADA
jgi:hypothetical protein